MTRNNQNESPVTVTNGTQINKNETPQEKKQR